MIMAVFYDEKYVEKKDLTIWNPILNSTGKNEKVLNSAHVK